MTRTTALVNIKGGVGKTTFVGQLGHSCARLDRAALMVEMDPQGNLTKRFTPYSLQNPPRVSLANVLDPRNDSQRENYISLAHAIVPTTRENLYIAPAGFYELQTIGDSLLGAQGAERRLKIALDTVADQYEHILIDCRPATDLLTRNALIAADDIILVVSHETAAIEGVQHVVKTLHDMLNFVGRAPSITGIIANARDHRRRDHNDNATLIEQTAQSLGVPILTTVAVITELHNLAEVGMSMDQITGTSAKLRLMGQDLDNIITHHLSTRKEPTLI